MAELSVAGIGAGYFSRFHYDAWARIPQTRLVGVADPDIARARAAGAPAYDDAARMLAETRPDIVDVVAPPAAHLDCIRLALDSGARAVICQKPFCRGLDEAREAVRLAAVAGVPLIVHENFRFQPWHRAMRRAIADGAVGALHQVTFRLRPGDGQGPRAYLDRQPYFQSMPRFLVHETAVHWIDLFRFLIGDPSEVYADLRRLNPAVAGEDAGHILFGYDDGARALFDGNRHLDHDADDLRRTMGEGLAEGADGTLSLTGDGALRLRRFGARRWETLLPAQDLPGFGGDCVAALQRHVAAGLLTGAPFENEAADYLAVIELEEAVYRSAAEGRKLRV